MANVSALLEEYIEGLKKENPNGPITVSKQAFLDWLRAREAREAEEQKIRQLETELSEAVPSVSQQAQTGPHWRGILPFAADVAKGIGDQVVGLAQLGKTLAWDIPKKTIDVAYKPQVYLSGEGENAKLEFVPPTYSLPRAFSQVVTETFTPGEAARFAGDALLTMAGGIGAKAAGRALLPKLFAGSSIFPRVAQSAIEAIGGTAGHAGYQTGLQAAGLTEQKTPYEMAVEGTANVVSALGASAAGAGTQAIKRKWGETPEQATLANVTLGTKAGALSPLIANPTEKMIKYLDDLGPDYAKFVREIGDNPLEGGLFDPTTGTFRGKTYPKSAKDIYDNVMENRGALAQRRDAVLAEIDRNIALYNQFNPQAPIVPIQSQAIYMHPSMQRLKDMINNYTLSNVGKHPLNSIGDALATIQRDLTGDDTYLEILRRLGERPPEEIRAILQHLDSGANVNLTVGQAHKLHTLYMQYARDLRKWDVSVNQPLDPSKHPHIQADVYAFAASALKDAANDALDRLPPEVLPPGVSSQMMRNINGYLHISYPLEQLASDMMHQLTGSTAVSRLLGETDPSTRIYTSPFDPTATRVSGRLGWLAGKLGGPAYPDVGEPQRKAIENAQRATNILLGKEALPTAADPSRMKLPIPMAAAIVEPPVPQKPAHDYSRQVPRSLYAIQSAFGEPETGIAQPLFNTFFPPQDVAALMQQWTELRKNNDTEREALFWLEVGKKIPGLLKPGAITGLQSEFDSGGGTKLYDPKDRETWLQKIHNSGLREDVQAQLAAALMRDWRVYPLDKANELMRLKAPEAEELWRQKYMQQLLNSRRGSSQPLELDFR